MKRKSIPNIQITAKENGKKYWISRSVAVCIIIYCYSPDGPKYGRFLVHTRGEGCPDYRGCMSTNCGYLDNNEYLKEGICREVYQELGLSIYPDQVEKLNEINDTLKGPQNITVRFLVRLPYEDIKKKLDSGIINNNTKLRGGEDDEVGKILFIRAEDIYKEKKFTDPNNENQLASWAFGHNKILKEVWERYIRVGENDFDEE